MRAFRIFERNFSLQRGQHVRDNSLRNAQGCWSPAIAPYNAHSTSRPSHDSSARADTLFVGLASERLLYSLSLFSID